MSVKYGKYLTISDYRNGARLIPIDQKNAVGFVLYSGVGTSGSNQRR